MKALWLILSLSYPVIAQADDYPTMTDRYALAGIITENNDEDRLSGIALIRDKQVKRNLVLRIGDSLPGHAAYRIVAINKKEVTISNDVKEYILSRESFAEDFRYAEGQGRFKFRDRAKRLKNYRKGGYVPPRLRNNPALSDDDDFLVKRGRRKTRNR